jgi:hypothetical protein
MLAFIYKAKLLYISLSFPLNVYLLDLHAFGLSTINFKCLLPLCTIHSFWKQVDHK